MQALYKELNELVLGGGREGLVGRFSQYFNQQDTSKAVNENLCSRLNFLLPEAGIVSKENSLENKVDEALFFTRGYIWAVDSINGNYPHGDWCVSVGLLKKEEFGFKPFLGSVYMPKCEELYFTDGEKSYITYLDKDITKQAPSTLNNPVVKMERQRRKYTYGKYDCAKGNSTAFNLVSVAFRDAIATVTSGYIWDIAAGMAIGMANNTFFYNANQQRMESLDSECFSRDENYEWKLDNSYFFCPAKNAEEVFRNVKWKIIPMQRA